MDMPGASEGQRKVSNPLELELETVINYLVDAGD